ncbi:MAG: hypothetical protein ACJ8GW_12235 [Massilia sp.]
MAATLDATHVYRASEMKSSDRFLRKSYAMQRMAIAIERAIAAATPKEKSRAARWAAAWGLLCDIKNPLPRLKASELLPEAPLSGRRAEDMDMRAPLPFLADAAAMGGAPPLAAFQPSLPQESGTDSPGELPTIARPPE